MRKNFVFGLLMLMAFCGAVHAATTPVSILIDGATDTWGSAFATAPVYVTPGVDLDGTSATAFVHVGATSEYANLTNKNVGDVSSAQYLEFDLFVNSVGPVDDAWFSFSFFKNPYDGVNYGSLLEYPGTTGTVGAWVHRKIAIGDLFAAAGMDWAAGGIMQITTSSTSSWDILIDNLAFTKDADAPAPMTVPVMTLVNGTSDTWGSAFVTDPAYVTPSVDLDGTQATEFIHIGGSSEYANLTSMAVGDVSSAQYLEFDLFVTSFSEPADQAWVTFNFFKDPFDGASYGSWLEYPGTTGTVGAWVHRKIALGDIYTSAGMDWAAGGIMQITTTSSSSWSILIDNLAFTKNEVVPVEMSEFCLD